MKAKAAADKEAAAKAKAAAKQVLTAEKQAATKQARIAESGEHGAAGEHGDAPLDDDRTCVVCLENARTHIAVPCGHFCQCEECATTCSPHECPMCRGKVTCWMKVFQ